MSWLLKSYVRLLYKLRRNLYNPKQNSVWLWIFAKVQNKVKRGEIIIVFRSGVSVAVGQAAWVFCWSLIFLEGNDPMAYAIRVCAYLPYNWHLLRGLLVWWMTVRVLPASFDADCFCMRFFYINSLETLLCFSIFFIYLLKMWYFSAWVSRDLVWFYLCTGVFIWTDEKDT